MKTWLAVLIGALTLAGADRLAPKPLFRDPVHDGAADPVVVWNRGEQKWFIRNPSVRRFRVEV